MGQNLLLLVGLAVAIHACVLGVHLVLLRQSVVIAADGMASQLEIINGMSSRIDPAQRAAALVALRAKGLRELDGAPPPASDRAPNAMPYALMAARHIQSELAPDVRFQWAFEGSSERATVYIQLNVAGVPTWFVSAHNADSGDYDPVAASLLLSLLLSVLATVAALLIQRRIGKPMRDAVAAAKQLSDGDRSVRLPVHGATELAALARQFNEMADSLEEAEATRALMLAGISHDIRTPLARLRLALALEGGSTEEMAARCIAQVDAIIGQFLHFGHAGSDEQEADCDLNILVEQVAAEFEAEGVSFDLKLERMPVMRLRPVAMQRVLQNLMENALKYAGTGMEVRSSVSGDVVQVSVLDRGPGLSAREQVRVRQPFVRGVSAGGVGGLGLGLAIVERLLQLQGGHLELLDRSGGGLEARIRLALRR